MTPIRNRFISSDLSSEEMERLALGPEAIERLTRDIETLAPLMRREDLHLTHKTVLEIRNPTTAEAALRLRNTVEAVIPIEIRRRIGDHSGLGWNAFFGHVLTVWFSQGCVGFLHVLRELCQFHKVDLQFHWNRGQVIPMKSEQWNKEPILWGALCGFAVGLACTQIAHLAFHFTVLFVFAGLVVGRIYSRLTRKYICGAPHCATPLKRKLALCPTCGATVVPPRKPQPNANRRTPDR